MAVIVFTSPTSGTASLDRIVHAVGKGRPFLRVNSPATPKGSAEGTPIDPDSDQIYWFQGPRYWNPAIPLEKCQVIAHVRDPRDLACNQYWWALQHPNDRDPPEVAEEKRRKVEAAGIDAFVLAANYADLYAVYRDIAVREAGNTVWTSYTQLCSAFDYLVFSLATLLEREPRDFVKKLIVERPENLGGNANWSKVGAVWQGADIGPGRFRRELQPETIKAAGRRFAEELAFCRSKEPDFLRPHYY